MTAFPIWFGPKERQLFGWIHLPEHAAAGFVLCPPIGIEGKSGYRGLTVLAERLEKTGSVVLRFDYTGTGDSAGDTSDVPTAETWLEDIRLALELVRGTGVPRVGLLGLRIGALLAAQVACRSRVDTLVLWDPCLTGYGFFREQKMLAATVAHGIDVVSDRSTRSVEIPTMSLPSGLADSLAELDLSTNGGKFPDETLVLTRPDGPSTVKLRERLSEQHIEWDEAPEQHPFFENESPYMPTRTIERIASWCARESDLFAESQIAPIKPQGDWSAAGVSCSVDGNRVIERPMTIEPRGLFGILSEANTEVVPIETEASPLAVVLINLASDRRTGPSRLWVDLGRKWAAQGARVLRLDLSGLGDSPASSDTKRYLLYPPGGIDDVVSAAYFLAPEDPSRVLLMGVCSGAYHAAEAAAVLRSKSVWLINPAVPTVKSFRDAGEGASIRVRRKAVRRVDPISRRLSRMPVPIDLAHKLMPSFGWWLLDKLGLFTFRLKAFDLLLEQGTETFIVCGEAESAPYVGRGQRVLDRRLRTGRLHFDVIKSLDHAVLMSGSRREVIRRLDDYVTEQLHHDDGNVVA